MQIEPWQIPVLTMAALALPPSVHWLVVWLRSKSRDPGPDAQRTEPEPTVNRERLRTTILAVLTVVLVIIFILALGPAAASILTSVASAVSALVSAVMTVQSYLMLVKIRRDAEGGSATPRGAAPDTAADQPDEGSIGGARHESDHGPNGGTTS